MRDLKEKIKILPCTMCEDMINCDECDLLNEAEELYNKVRAEVIDLLKDDYGNCEGTNKCNNCMFSRYGKIDCVLDTELNS